jgi:hypothetical protein
MAFTPRHSELTSVVVSTIQAPSFRHSTLALLMAFTSSASLRECLISIPARASVEFPDWLKFVISWSGRAMPSSPTLFAPSPVGPTSTGNANFKIGPQAAFSI